MRFFEDVVSAVRKCKDTPVARLVLGWHASLIVALDGRWGIGCVPNSLKEAHTAREAHTNLLLEGSMIQLAELIVSPFPQEFAAATAACSALLPFPEKGFSMDAIMPCVQRDKVAVLGYQRDLVSMMRDWGWNVAIFDDNRQGCFPQKDFAEGAARADWVWLPLEAIRDRWLISTADILKTKKGCFLQGPGLPWLREGFASLGVTHLVAPVAVGGAETILARISAGGDPWLCPDLEWRVHSTAV